MTTLDEAKALVEMLFDFFPEVPRNDRTVEAYAARLKRYKHVKAAEVVNNWIDRAPKFPSWSELRRELERASRLPRSIAEQDENRPEWQKEIAACSTAEEANAVLKRHANATKARAS